MTSHGEGFVWWGFFPCPWPVRLDAPSVKKVNYRGRRRVKDRRGRERAGRGARTSSFSSATHGTICVCTAAYVGSTCIFCMHACGVRVHIHLYYAKGYVGETGVCFFARNSRDKFLSRQLERYSGHSSLLRERTEEKQSFLLIEDWLTSPLFLLGYGPFFRVLHVVGCADVFLDIRSCSRCVFMEEDA